MQMDVEKTIEFILGQSAHTAAMLEQAKVQADEHLARHDRQIAQINEILRRAVRLAVQEARADRRRRREADERFDLRMDQLASAQLLTEEILQKLGDKLDKLGEKIDKFVDGIHRPGGNGRPH
jgi:hypothetical protein